MPQSVPTARVPGSLASSLALLKPLLLVVALLLAMGAGLAGAGRWLLLSEEGATWLVSRLPSVQISGWRGPLLGGHWQADRVRSTWDGGKAWVQLEALDMQGLHIVFRPHRQAWLAVTVDNITVNKLSMDTGPRGKRPIPLPQTLAWPVQLNVDQLRLDELVVDQQDPLRQVLAQGLALDPRPGGRHGVQALQADWQDLKLTGDASVGVQRPFVVQAALALRSAGRADGRAQNPASGRGAQPPWGADLKLSGELERLVLTGQLRSRTLTGQGTPPSADLVAGLRVLQDWPLADLQLRTQALDLSALARSAPRTALSGTVDIKTSAVNAPITAALDLRNTQAGPWDQGRLPLQALKAQVMGSMAQRDRLDFKQVDATFASGGADAGRFSGSAVWQNHQLQFKSQLDGLAPHLLDGRAAAMRLSGPLTATVSGLPSPAGQTAGTKLPAWQLTSEFDLQGQLDGAPQPVQLAATLSANAQRLDIQTALARSGNASAEAQAVLQRGPQGNWQLQTQGQVKDFDPLPWWRGDKNSPLHKGPHRLTAQWTLDLALPADALNLSPVALAQTVAGNGVVKVQDSLLAGLPVGGDINISYSPTKTQAPAALRASFNIAGNPLTIEGDGDPTGPGQSDRWRVKLQADKLTALAPLATLQADLAEWLPQQGSVNASLVAEGRWPDLRSEGTVQVSGLRTVHLQLATANAQWRVDADKNKPLALQIDMAGIQSGEGARLFQADHLRADVRGTLSSHRIELSGAMPLGPPPWLATVLDVGADSGTRIYSQARGAWLPNPAVPGSGQWRGLVEQLLVGAWDGSPTTGPPAAGWADGRGLRTEIEFGPGGELLSAKAEAGQVTLARNLVMRWDDVQIDLRGARAQWQLRATVEPFDVATLLARAQPDMGWQGNLSLRAQLDIHAADRLDLDLALERASGDLQIRTGDLVQALGLSELKIALTAHDGIWRLTPLLKGSGMGELSGSLRINSTPQSRWPDRKAPLQGQVVARAADVGIWGVWVPAGWRLVGEVSTTATIGGTFAAPAFTGELVGHDLGVRNLLQGVDVSGGEVAIKLDGDSARIERFTLRGGDGRIAVTGGADLGENPIARLQVQADHFRALGRIDRMVIASGSADLLLRRQGSEVKGKFTIDEGLIDARAADAPTLDSDVNIRGSDVVDTEKEGADPNRKRSNLSLLLDVNLGDKLRVRGRGLDTTLRGNLRFTNPEGRLAVYGAIRSDTGTYAAYGQKLDIERGVITFSGPLDNPRLDVLALRPNIDDRVGVYITGPALTPRIRLYAESDMSETDKLSWLVLGRAPDGLGRADTALLQRAAVALLAGEKEAPTDTLLKSLGIDEISLRQETGAGDVRETVITLGKQLSRRWYVGYERGVNATTGTWQLIYRIAQRFTLRAQSGTDNSLDVIWVWRPQPAKPPVPGVRTSPPKAP